MREAEIKRNTNETRISLTLNLDGSGKAEVSSGCGFLDHMLTLFARHALVDLKLCCEGDTSSSTWTIWSSPMKISSTTAQSSRWSRA